LPDLARHRRFAHIRRFILLQSSHTHGPDEVCPTCGQAFPPPGRPLQYGDNKPNRTGLAVAVGLHALILLLVLMNPDVFISMKPPAKEGELVYLSPPSPVKTPPSKQPTPQKSTPQKQAKVAPSKSRPTPQPRTNANAITEPRKQETFTPPVQADMTPPPPEVSDMSQMVEAARRRRGAVESPSAETAESADAKGKARAMANIMGAQGRNAAGEREDTGGIFDVQNKTFNSADLKFRGWNTNFKRRWMTQVRVELGSDVDIENAIVSKMIELIRKEKPGEFEWESHRLGRTVKMSARREDEAELRAFLIKEMFQGYIRPAGR
jgi:hypothetical protein